MGPIRRRIPNMTASAPDNGTLGTFFSLTGKNPVSVAQGQAQTPYQAAVDVSVPEPSASTAELLFGEGNLTQTRAYLVSNLPPYNFRNRRDMTRPWFGQQVTPTSSSSSLLIGLAVAAGLIFVVSQNH